MARLRVHNLSISLDGYAAGPAQSLANPLGMGGEDLHGWAFATKYFRGVHNLEAGDEGVDNDWAARERGIGATIMGRNMFGGHPGPWDSSSPWKGWWGNDPPFHHAVFVLTHHARDPLPMAGGTTFHFVTEGIESALERAAEAARGQDVRLGGGVATIQQYLRAGLIDEMHVAMAPRFLGSGERLFDGLDGALDRYEVTTLVGTGSAVHVVLTKTGA